METDGPGVEFPWNVQYRIQNDDPGIALEPGESNVVDMSLAIPAGSQQWLCVAPWFSLRDKVVQITYGPIDPHTIFQ